MSMNQAQTRSHSNIPLLPYPPSRPTAAAQVVFAHLSPNPLSASRSESQSACVHQSGQQAIGHVRSEDKDATSARLGIYSSSSAVAACQRVPKNVDDMVGMEKRKRLLHFISREGQARLGRRSAERCSVVCNAVPSCRYIHLRLRFSGK